MSYYDQRQRPLLKNGVDIQLQSAFSEQNWATVIRLADKRAKASQDPYYEVVKVCAETKLDGIADKAAGAVTVDAWVRNGTVPRDLEAIELLEWACDEDDPLSSFTSLSYASTFGVLRFRWVKANPRNVKAGTACLRECLLAWDLANAQQIATVLDKSSNTHDRRFMFWSIVLTHLLAANRQQCGAEAKRKIYGMLVQKQLEKAAEAVEASGLATSSTNSSVAATDRSLRDEEEFLLYLRVLAAHGTQDNYVQRALHAKAGAAAQFAAAGRKQLFYEVLAQLEAGRRWDAVFDLCHQALSTTEDGGLSGSSRPSTLACDLKIWTSFITAAQRRENVEKAFDEVQALLSSFITAEPKLPQMYMKNVSLALLQTTFSLPPALLPEPAQGESSLQVEQLLVFIEANLDKASVFNDVRAFIERLSFSQSRDLLHRLSATTAQEEKGTTTSIVRSVLVFKLRYLLATCPETRCPRSLLLNQTEADSALLNGSGNLFELACKVCRHAAPQPSGCTHCLQDIATGSLRLHHTLAGDATFVQDAVPKLDKDPRIDLALVAASSLLRLSGIHQQRSRTSAATPGLNTTRLLQAALVLDSQQRQTPDDIPLRLLLIRVEFRLGCASHALQLWGPLGVKRSILDALGPLFYDRLTTVAPGLFSGSSKPLHEPLQQYFSTVLRHPSAVKVWDAFASGSYSSILDMAAFHESLQHSCTRVMTVVEWRRAARLFGGKLADVETLPIFAEITNDVTLVNATDYGSIPNLESSYGASLAEALSLGPGLSNLRMHLGLLAERYLDLINFKPAKEYKPAKPNEAAARDKAFMLESLSMLQLSLDDFLHQPDARAHLTPGEWTYYTVVSVLVSFVAFSLANASSGPKEAAAASPDIFPLLNQTLTTSVDVLRKSALSKALSSSPTTDSDALLRTFTDIHSMSMLRDAAMAIKQTAAFIAAYHDKETARDRSGKSGFGKETLAGARAFKELAAHVLAAVKVHVKSAKDTLGAPGWLDRIADLVAATGQEEEDKCEEEGSELSRAVLDAAGGATAVEDWAGHLLDGWRETIKGWGQVQLE